MPREYRLYLQDMLDAARRIIEVAADASIEQLQERRNLQESVLWNLHVIGEAAKNIPEDVRNEYAGVDWRKAAAMRDRIVHAYFGVDWGIVHHTINKQLPVLVEDLRELTDRLNGQP